MIPAKSILSIQFLRILFIPVIIILISCTCSIAQDNAPITFGKVKTEDFAVNSPAIDSNSNAVTVFDKGDISFVGNKTGWFSYVLKRSTRIKILNKKGFDLATVELLLYKDKDSKEIVEKLTGITYNLENGIITETKLNSKEVYEEKSDKEHFTKKFTMPAVKEGSIIEYSYTIKSDFIFNLPSWEFQSAECPILWSEFNLSIPGFLSYMSVFQGYHKFYIDKSGEGFGEYSITRGSPSSNAYGTGSEERYYVTSPTTLHRWVMKNNPAFYAENYISTPDNIIDKIGFQLYKTYDGENFHDVANNWKKVTEELMAKEDFGKSLTEENAWLDKVLEGVVLPNDDALQAAKKVYYYLQNNYTCNNHYDKYIKTNLRDVVKKKSGTIGDINLLMIALLNHLKIDAYPVLLSTKEFGTNSPTYPLLQKLNYVIGKININSIEYYLDASIPFLPFGKLPLNCYNGHARVISNDTTAVYFEPDLINETKTTSIFIINNEKNDVDGAFTQKLGLFKSLDTKTSIAKSTLQAFESNLKTAYPEEMEISNIKVDSFQIPEAAVTIKFDFKLPAFGDADIIYFNPFIGDDLKKNPFYAAERIYPVERPYTIDDLYILNMEIPKGYKIDELPKPVRTVLNNTEGSFEYLLQANAGTIQIRSRLILNKATFAPGDYKTLRDFYAFIVKKKAEQIVFKKIK